MTIGPRLLILTYFFGNCDLMVFSVGSFFIACSIFLISYCVTFLLPTVLMYQKLKVKTDSGKYFQNLLWAFISAMISPCIVIHPRSMTFLFSSIASALAHCGLLIFVHFTYSARSKLSHYIGSWLFIVIFQSWLKARSKALEARLWKQGWKQRDSPLRSLGKPCPSLGGLWRAK